MKKLFVSCPMKGRTEENIKKSIEKMHKIAEIVFDQELELIDSYQPCLPDGTYNTSIYCLGKSIQKMADADYFIGIQDWSNEFKGCMIEREIAQMYHIEYTLVDMQTLMPDAVLIERYRDVGCYIGEVNPAEDCDNCEEAE